jgi:hypothetical protein
MWRSPTCRLPSPDKKELDPVVKNKLWPLRQMRRSPTCHLPSPEKKELDPVAKNKSWSLVPLLPMAQVRAYLPATGCRGLGTMC